MAGTSFERWNFRENGTIGVGFDEVTACLNAFGRAALAGGINASPLVPQPRLPYVFERPGVPDRLEVLVASNEFAVCRETDDFRHPLQPGEAHRTTVGTMPRELGWCTLHAIVDRSDMPTGATSDMVGVRVFELVRDVRYTPDLSILLEYSQQAQARQ